MNLADRRPNFRKGLNELYLPFYDKLCSLLGPSWQPYSGYRDPVQQDELFSIGRKQNELGEWIVVDPRKIETKARGGQSAHNYGCATDWTWFDDEGVLKWLGKEDPRWQEYIDAVTSAGLRPGAEFGDVDHNEIRLSVPWTTIQTVLNAQGMTGALAAVKTSMVTLV